MATAAVTNRTSDWRFILANQVRLDGRQVLGPPIPEIVDAHPRTSDALRRAPHTHRISQERSKFAL